MQQSQRAGFTKAYSDNLPRVDAEMIAQYFVNNPDYVSAEIKGVKHTRSSRQSYGDEAIGFVQLKREGKICIVNCRITPEHKIHKKDYHVDVEIDEAAEKIISAKCLDCVASPGGCKHSTAFIFWLHRRSEEPATTAKECYWKATKLAKAGRGKTFVRLGDLVQKEPPALPPATGEFRAAVLETGIAQKSLGMIFDRNLKSECVLCTSLHQLSLTFLESLTELDEASSDSFVNFCSTTMTKTFCMEVEILTRGQDKSSLWSELRYGRVTASRAHETSRCTTFDGVLVERIMGAEVALASYAVKRGKDLERKVLEIVAARMDVEINPCGIFLDPKWPFIGASPDGINNDCCFEVKCPSKDSTIENYIKNGDITNAPYAQMQLQMHLTQKKKCIFCIASPGFESNNEVDIIECKYNANFCENLIKKCRKFWEKAIFPKLVNM